MLLALAFILAAAPVPELSLPPRAETLRIVVVGDTGNGTVTVAEGIRRVHAEQPLDAILLTGDNFYPCGVLP